jgi:Holliday junction resolvase RusA-like endonuclease
MIREIAFHVAGTPAPKGSMVEFFVAGTARPKGSKRMVRTSGGRTILIEMSGPEKSWRELVGQCGLEAMRGRSRFVDHPLTVVMVFGFARPKSHYTSKGLRANAPAWHVARPDVSKLVRSAEDALSGIVFDDDSRIAHLLVSKRYCTADEPTGVAIFVDAIAGVLPEPHAFYRRLAGASALPLAPVPAEQLSLEQRGR